MPRTEPKISRTALFKKLEYEPHSEQQWDAHTATNRFRIMCCGRRWGKSQWAGHEMTLKMFVPQSINWIVGPEYKLGEKEFRVVWNDFKKKWVYLGDAKNSTISLPVICHYTFLNWNHYAKLNLHKNPIRWSGKVSITYV